MQKIIPHLWFDSRAEEAARFYVSIFNDAEITDLARYGKAGAEVSGMPEGTVMTVGFRLEGQDFVALNGGPAFTFSPAISFFVNCETREEVDMLWKYFTEGGGEPSQCGWVTDKYGISWQVVPAILGKLMQDKDAARSERVMQAMLTMQKLDIEVLQKAYENIV